LQFTKKAPSYSKQELALSSRYQQLAPNRINIDYKHISERITFRQLHQRLKQGEFI